MEAFIKYSPPVVFILAAFYFLYKSKNRQRWVNKVGYSMVFVPFAWFYLGIGPFITDYVDALMAEKALAEQMEQGGFVDQGVYYKAQSLNIPTKALYDKHLKEQEEFYARLKEEDAEKKRLAAERAKAAEKARIAALTPQQRCEEDLAGCRDIDLCETATYGMSGKTKRWKEENNTKFIEEAAQRNLDCGARVSAKELLAEAFAEKIAKSNELIRLTEHIRRGGDYGVINILDLDAKLFIGKTCTEIVRLRTKRVPQPEPQFGYIVSGGRKQVAEIGAKGCFNDCNGNYRMPKGCNLSSSNPKEIERSCNLGTTFFGNDFYDRYYSTDLVRKFGRLKSLGGQDEDKLWRVIADDDGKNLTSAVVTLKKNTVFMNKPFKIKSRAYICRH